MVELRPRHFLPAILGSLHQQRVEGELVLEQNDGTRRLYWSDGNLKHLRSDAVGEQFGNFLIRRGVLDMAVLKEMLADSESARVGERVVQLGLMNEEARDGWLQELLSSVLLHAMEHTVVRVEWNPGPLGEILGGDIQFRVNHRRLIWDTYQKARIDQELAGMFQSEPDWRWKAPSDLLESLSDLPLTPTLAYALSLLGREPLGCQTIASLSGLSKEETHSLVAILWALGGLSLVEGTLPLGPKPEPPPQPPKSDSIPESIPEPILLLQEDLTPTPGATPSKEPVASGTAPEPPVTEPTPREALAEEEPSPFERARYLMVKAKSFMVQERTSEAIRALEQSVQLDADSPQAYSVWLLLGRLRLGNPAWSTRAIEALQAASRIDAKAAEPWALMGELYHRKGFLANAQGCFRRALELDPSVAVPAGFTLEEPAAPQVRAEEGGLVGKLRFMLGRDKT